VACDPHKPLLPSCSASPACVLLQPVTHSCLSCLLLLHSCRIVLLLPALVALMPCWCRSCLLLLHSCHTGAALACSSCPHAILVLLQLALVALMPYWCCSSLLLLHSCHTGAAPACLRPSPACVPLQPLCHTRAIRTCLSALGVA